MHLFVLIVAHNKHDIVVILRLIKYKYNVHAFEIMR